MIFIVGRISQPKNPHIAIQFCDQSTTYLAIHLKAIAILGERIAITFFSENTWEVFGDLSEIQFDETVYVMILSYQSFTIFLSIGRLSVPGIHCLTT